MLQWFLTGLVANCRVRELTGRSVCACGVWKKSINKMADTRGHSEGAGSRQSNQNLRSKRKSLVTGAMNGESVEGRYDSESK